MPTGKGEGDLARVATTGLGNKRLGAGQFDACTSVFWARGTDGADSFNSVLVPMSIQVPFDAVLPMSEVPFVASTSAFFVVLFLKC